MPMVLTNCNLIDCVTEGVLPDATVVVDGGCIVSVASGQEPTLTPGFEEEKILDLAGAYLLPGLWDVHIHPEYPNPAGTTVPQLTAWFGQNLMRGLTEAGSHRFAAQAPDTSWTSPGSGRSKVRPGPGRAHRLRLRPLPHHHRRPLPDLRPRPRVRRPLRLRQRPSASRSRTASTTSS